MIIMNRFKYVAQEDGVYDEHIVDKMGGMEYYTMKGLCELLNDVQNKRSMEYMVLKDFMNMLNSLQYKVKIFLENGDYDFDDEELERLCNVSRDMLMNMNVRVLE